ncbi:hypothetical protein EDC04DRAFT_2606007 [Pisolithus marmoratus]|nr:hypothetical protein EDC04DRAFT_2606007 [Pisolithus marmoratus]
MMRVDPELEIPYGHTGNTVLHSWEVLPKILAGEDTMNILCDIKMMSWEDHYLPWTIQAVMEQAKFLYGDCRISPVNGCIGIGIFKELFTPSRPLIVAEPICSHHDIKCGIIKHYEHAIKVYEGLVKRASNDGINLFARYLGQLGFVALPNTCSLMGFNKIFGMLAKQSQPSPVSAPLITTQIASE